jgi:hypothetical protein
MFYQTGVANVIIKEWSAVLAAPNAPNCGSEMSHYRSAVGGWEMSLFQVYGYFLPFISGTSISCLHLVLGSLRTIYHACAQAPRAYHSAAPGVSLLDRIEACCRSHEVLPRQLRDHPDFAFLKKPAPAA